MSANPKLFKVEIDLANDATQNVAELAGLLRIVAAKVQYGQLDGGRIVDANGNDVGRWRFVGGRKLALSQA